MKPSVTVFANSFTAGGIVYVDLTLGRANAAALQLFNAYGTPIVDFGGTIVDNDQEITFTLGTRQIELPAGSTVRQTFDRTLENPTAEQRAVAWPKTMTTRIAAAIQALADQGDPLVSHTATTIVITPD